MSDILTEFEELTNDYMRRVKHTKGIHSEEYYSLYNLKHNLDHFIKFKDGEFGDDDEYKSTIYLTERSMISLLGGHSLKEGYFSELEEKFNKLKRDIKLNSILN
jgi:hypothetical protein